MFENVCVRDLRPGDVIVGGLIVDRVVDTMIGQDSIDIVYADGSRDRGGIYPSTIVRRETRPEPNFCDKCGEVVPAWNDACLLELLLTGVERTRFFGPIPGSGSRHLLAVDKCEGSPSRAQYLEGVPRDTRGFAYDSDLEEPMRRAYSRLRLYRPQPPTNAMKAA